MFKPWLLSHLRTAGQSWRKVGVNIGSLFLETYRNDGTQSDTGKVWEGEDVSEAIWPSNMQCVRSILAP